MEQLYFVFLCKGKSFLISISMCLFYPVSMWLPLGLELDTGCLQKDKHAIHSQESHAHLLYSDIC